MKEKVILQKIYMCAQEPYINDVKKMYYRGKSAIVREDSCYMLREKSKYDFSTYFNSLSVEKWKYYTYAEKIFLQLEATGSFCIQLLGYFVNDYGQAKKEILHTVRSDLKERKRITIEIPDREDISVVSFQIETITGSCIYEASYVASVDSVKVNKPYITLVTTTYKKEKYVKQNMELLESTIFAEPVYGEHFSWKIIDNGRTLDFGEFSNDKIKLYYNNNVGGSGGFARGMIETINDERRSTHILLMDDDVVFSPDSFRRLFTLLSIMKPEYSDHFISGAMLELSEKNIQHEDVGFFSIYGEHGPVKPRFNLKKAADVVKNEKILMYDPHQYCGWWYCCIPMAIIRLDNLPLPLFVRGDDVEYSIRNHAKFITMNGICIWHDGFGGKFSGALELYQVIRNDLILTTMNDKETEDIHLIDRIKWLFWQEIYKFNYKGADLLLDAVDDFLNGPEFLISLDAEQCMREKKDCDNVMSPITPDVEALINYKELYVYETLNKFKKFVYDHTCNGHRLPEFVCISKPGIIPHGIGYFQNKMFFTKVNYAVDSVNRTYTKYERNNLEYRRLRKRFKTVFDRYSKENAAVKQRYVKAAEYMHSLEFWRKHLGMNG